MFHGVSVSIAEQIEQSSHALTAGDLARLLNVHKLTIYRMAQAGTLPCFRINSAVRFDPRAVARVLRERSSR
jgi:excisionase family DNA binding protein